MTKDLSIIVKESGLEQTKADFLLQNFQDYFKIASEWEIKAKTIIVTDESQKAEMAMARSGRLFLREKRIAIEKARKDLKEQSLRECKAIDGIANVLKALIEPIEEYLDNQEHFVEIKQAEKERLEKIELEKKIEQERIAKEKAEAKERERIRLENEKLRAEAIKAEQERNKLEAEKKAIEEKARKEKEEADRKRIEAERKRIEAERKAEAEKKALQAELDSLITCPSCGHKFKK